jgi:predicted nucleic acid-binding protein
VDSFFVDTNILLYQLDSRDAKKQRLADLWCRRLWENRTGRLSWQVLNEFYFNATQKLGAPRPAIRKIAEAYASWQPVDFGLGLVQRAWHWQDLAGIPYWDSLIVSAAEVAGCEYLLSEDFQEGRRFGRVAVVNPFSPPSEFGL